jgi:hypothetical protein
MTLGSSDLLCLYSPVLMHVLVIIALVADGLKMGFMSYIGCKFNFLQGFQRLPTMQRSGIVEVEPNQLT